MISHVTGLETMLVARRHVDLKRVCSCLPFSA
ncbi:putative leader peptide [Rhodococcus kronopolitis]|uniref:Leader peptide n=1 Tax=Rhodococcus kronopolitis TaxID=1460226 RepID=A0ABV9FQ75_9NOCA